LATFSRAEPEARHLPSEVAAWRQPASVQLEGGTVKVAGQTFRDAATLAANPLVADVVAVRDTLRRPAMTRLVNDPAAGYRFATWGALALALGDWDGTLPVPVAVRQRRVPQHPLSALATWNPAVTVTRDNLRECERRI